MTESEKRKILVEWMELVLKNMHTHHRDSANYDEFNADMSSAKQLTARLRDHPSHEASGDSSGEGEG